MKLGFPWVCMGGCEHEELGLEKPGVEGSGVEGSTGTWGNICIC